MKWDKFVKRYVWDDDKTPYFVRASKLTKVQAQNEIFVYALFLAVMFAIYTIDNAAAVVHRGESQYLPVALYAFSLTAGATVLWLTKHLYSALYCLSAPPAVLLYLTVFGFPPTLARIDEIAIYAILALWLFYGLRVVAVTKHYPDMPETGEEKEESDD